MQPQLDFLQRATHDKACQKKLVSNKQRQQNEPKGKNASSSAVNASKYPLLRDIYMVAECTIPLLMDRKLLRNKKQGRR